MFSAVWSQDRSGLSVCDFHILEVIVFRIPFNFALPGRNRIISHFSHTQNTESEKRWALALVIRYARLHKKLVDIHAVNLTVFEPVISVCSLIRFPVSLNNCPNFSRILNSPHSLVQDELLLEE